MQILSYLLPIFALSALAAGWMAIAGYVPLPICVVVVVLCGWLWFGKIHQRPAHEILPALGAWWWRRLRSRHRWYRPVVLVADGEQPAALPPVLSGLDVFEVDIDWPTISQTRSLGVVLGVSAMLMIALPEASLPAAGLTVWVFVALIAPFCYGIEGNYVAMQAPRRLNPLAALWGASVIGLCLITPLTVASGQWIDLFKPWQAPEWAMAGTAIAHLIAYSGYIWLVGFAGVVFTAQISYIVTLAGITNSMLFLGESYSAWVWLAVALMLAGLALVQPVGRLPEVEETP